VYSAAAGTRNPDLNVKPSLQPSAILQTNPTVAHISTMADELRAYLQHEISENHVSTDSTASPISGDGETTAPDESLPVDSQSSHTRTRCRPGQTKGALVQVDGKPTEWNGNDGQVSILGCSL
jgi:hypothetical protein